MAELTQQWTINDREFTLLSRLIHEKTGIDLKETKRALLISRLGRRLRELGLSSFLEYHRLLTAGGLGAADELRDMINSITTNKTSFFRESSHFTYLAGILRARLSDPMRRRPYRVWSAACSTGEEPYTIAITALEAMGPHASSEVEILATDIDTEVLARASAGVYNEPGADAMPAQLRKKYFLRGEGAWQGLARVKPNVREMVHFAQLNLVSPWTLAERFDAIFCRNVAIYFNQETQRALFLKLLGHLRTEGLLFIGHSESLQWYSDAVAPVEHAIYRQRHPGAPA